MDVATINTGTVELRTSGNALVAAVVTYNATTRVATLNPTPTLAALATYTVTNRGGAIDPRVKDVAGNALAADRTWSFVTGPVGAGAPGPSAPARLVQLGWVRRGPVRAAQPSGRAGLPATVLPGETGRITVLPMPISAPAPIVKPFITLQPLPR